MVTAALVVVMVIKWEESTCQGLYTSSTRVEQGCQCCKPSCMSQSEEGEGHGCHGLLLTMPALAEGAGG